MEIATTSVLKMVTVRHGVLKRKNKETPALVVRCTVDIPKLLWKRTGKFANLYSIHTHPTLDLSTITDHKSFFDCEGFKLEGFNEDEYEKYARPLIVSLYPEAVHGIRTDRFAMALNRAAWIAWWKTEGAMEADETNLAPVELQFNVTVDG